MAGGTIRGDQVYGPGVLRLRDIMDCFPFEDPVIVICVKGKAIREALENSVALFPALEGRFSQVSGIRFCYDPSLSPGQRVKWVEVADQAVEEEKKYSLATRGYMGRGKDGFASLLVASEGGEAEEVVSEENGMLISMILRQYFMSLQVMGRWKQWGPSLGKHWGDVQTKFNGQGSTEVGVSRVGHTHTRSGNVKEERAGVGDVNGDINEDTDSDIPPTNPSSAMAKMNEAQQERRKRYLAKCVTRHWMRRVGIKYQDVDVVDGNENGNNHVTDWTKGICPKIEGRIVVEKSTNGVNGD